MRAITVHRPWSFAIAWLGKDVENRTRPLSYRGEIAIHAGKVWSSRGTDMIRRLAGRDIIPWNDVPTRETAEGIVAVADLVGCHHATECYKRSRGQRLCSLWAELSVWHLELRDVYEVDPAVPCRGWQGLWTVPADVEAAVRAQIGARP